MGNVDVELTLLVVIPHDPSKTVIQANIGNGLNQMRYIIRPYYRLAPGLNINVEYEHEQDYGAFKNIQIRNGEAASQNTVTFGLTVLL